MKVFVTGACGQLGHDCLIELLKRGHEAIGSDIQMNINCAMNELVNSSYVQLDITDPENVHNILESIRPDAIIHCAAWTAVDEAEDEKNQGKVFAINALGTRYIAEETKRIDSKLLYVSTDYVFNGKGVTPWQPEDQCYEPLNVYGQSKLDGELAVSSILEKFFVVRTAWVFGLNGKNFIRTMINVGKTHDSVRVVDDQIGTPTYTVDLAKLLVDMIETEKYGYYHATNSETKKDAYISWADLAQEVFHLSHMNVNVERVSTNEYGFNRAQRPYNSRLCKTKLISSGFQPLPNWKDAVQRYLEAANL